MLQRHDDPTPSNPSPRGLSKLQLQLSRVQPTLYHEFRGVVCITFSRQHTCIYLLEKKQVESFGINRPIPSPREHVGGSNGVTPPVSVLKHNSQIIPYPNVFQTINVLLHINGTRYLMVNVQFCMRYQGSQRNVATWSSTTAFCSPARLDNTAVLMDLNNVQKRIRLWQEWFLAKLMEISIQCLWRGGSVPRLNFCRRRRWSIMTTGNHCIVHVYGGIIPIN